MIVNIVYTLEHLNHTPMYSISQFSVDIEHKVSIIMTIRQDSELAVDKLKSYFRTYNKNRLVNL